MLSELRTHIAVPEPATDPPALPAAPEPASELRLRWLTASADADEVEVLRRALQQAVAAVRGLGGLAHLAGRDEGTLQLVAVSGLPPDLARRWEVLDRSEAGLAPVQAVISGTRSWSVTWPHHSAGTGAGTTSEVGVFCVPLIVNGIPVGALSILTAQQPDPEQQHFLSQIASVVAARLPTAHRAMTGRPPWWQEPTAPATVDQVGVGLWSWELSTGLCYIDQTCENLLRLAGLEPHSWDRHIESWFERIHPDDRPAVEAATEHSFATLTPYAVEYRVLDGHGQISWLEVRATFVAGNDGQPVRMDGTICDVTERRSQQAWLAGLMDAHPDPLYVVSTTDVTVWMNAAARSMACGGMQILNQVPWDAVPALAQQGLPQLLERARSAPGAAVTNKVAFPGHSPDGQLAHFQLRAVDIGGHAAVSMVDVTEQTRAEEQTRRRADRLEAELLPGRPPSLTGVNAAALYRTASGQRVAGHWYDTLPLPGGRTLLAIGDVHDITDSLEAAITMGILRHALLTFAEQDLPLDEILARLTDSALRLSQRGPAVTASCLLVEYDATTGRCSMASAGHAPPILIRPGAEPAALGMPVGQPIGAAQLPAEVTEMDLPDGSVLVLHTAGLLGHAGGGSDPAALIDAVHRHAPGAAVVAGGSTAWLASLCEAVTGDLLGGHPADAAVVAVSTHRIPDQDVAVWDLPRTPESAATARTAVAYTLAGWHLDDVAESAQLIVSELIGNTVRYARGIDDTDGDSDIDGEVIRLRLLNLEGAVTVECYDGSEATPRVRHPHLSDEFGRGLQLVAAATAQHWGTRYTEHGKCVWAVPASAAEPLGL